MALDVTRLSPQDALDVAILMEEEARERYELFTRMVGGRYAGDAADMFRMMASYEKRHGAELARRKEALYPGRPARITRDMIYDLEAPDLGTPRVFMSARQAMEVALSAEEKAHDFYAAAVQRVTDPQVRALFEELRQEEREHGELVRGFIEKLPPGPDVEEEEADEPGTDPGN